MEKQKLLVITHTNLGTSLSGGDRIFLNLIKEWQEKFQIISLASPEAKKLIIHFKLKNKIILTTHKIHSYKLSTLNLIRHHLSRFITGIIFCLKNKNLFKNAQYIYTASDFYGDYIFGVFAKIYNPRIKWLCGYYLLAPTPFDDKSPYIANHQYIRGIVYYFAQLPTIIITKLLADHVFVTSEPDKKYFGNNAIVVQGGVYIPSPKRLKTMLPVKKRFYDGFFLGRLHSQKGVVELIDIWKLVTKKKPLAKLVIVGDGELLPKIINKISQYKLEKNITLVGFLIGKEKFNFIKNSKIVLHPATHDSGGMAAAEAMAWGLPGVSYDLPALKTYYPKGMIKVPCYDHKIFASKIIELLSNKKIYNKYSIAARELTENNWGWKHRFSQIYEVITERQ